MLEATGQASVISRMIRAAKLEPQLYEEVERDRSATGQALLVVALGTIAAGIGTLSGGVSGLILGIILALVGWAAYAFVAYWVGTNFFQGRQTSATWGELLRTLGFASSPRVLLVFTIIPAIGLFIGLALLIWTFIATVIAVRQALHFDTGSAVATAIASSLALFVISLIITAAVAA